ncbi:MAG: ketopantoate reductase family protein [Oscillospiraceae bacterium]|jgi:2-dehydropantoate 2-reductase|nr:ketopantoate reductase family protein [Oscillospiraceae bacterium]
MKAIKTVAIVGLGAIGAIFYERLLQTLPMSDISVIADGERAERLRRDGITLNGKRLDVPVAPPHTDTPADLVVIAVKAGALGDAIALVRDWVGGDTVVLSLLNGITSERTISDALGRGHVLYSYAVGTDSTWVGGGIQCTRMFTIPFGDAVNVPDALSPEVQRLQAFFERANVPHEVPENMLRSLWWKWTMNMGVNQALAVTRETYAALVRDGFARELARDAMLEAIQIAQLEGVALEPDDAQRALDVIDTISPDGKPSTLQDVEARRRTEIEMFSGDLLRLAEKHGVTLPVNAVLYRVIKAIDEDL